MPIRTLIGLTVAAVLVVGIALVLKRPSHPTLSFQVAPAPSGTTFQVRFNSDCIKHYVKGEKVLLSVRATRLTTDERTVANQYEVNRIVEMKQLGENQMVMFSLADLTTALATKASNLMISIAICNQKEGKCADPALFQAFRMNGAFLEQVADQGNVALELVKDHTVACHKM